MIGLVKFNYKKSLAPSLALFVISQNILNDRNFYNTSYQEIVSKVLMNVLSKAIISHNFIVFYNR